MRQNGKCLKHQNLNKQRSLKPRKKPNRGARAERLRRQGRSRYPCGRRCGGCNLADWRAAPRRSWARHTCFLVGRKRLSARLSPAPIAPASGGQDSRQASIPITLCCSWAHHHRDDQIKEMPSQ